MNDMSKKPVINGVYEFEYNDKNSNPYVPGAKYCVVPKDHTHLCERHRVRDIEPGNFVLFIDECLFNKYPKWEYTDDEALKLGKLVGMYDWENKQIIFNNEKTFLVSSETSETTDTYESGIFCAKVTTRNNGQWVHFDCIGAFDDGVYGYTKDEFLALMPILREIETKLLNEEID